MSHPTTLVWISGATEGIGSGLARQVPWKDARVINLSRSAHPDLETVRFDLTKPETYGAVQESFRRELADFKGERAIFFHNAFYHTPAFFGYVSEVDQAGYADCIQANAVAPLILGDMFLREIRNDFESGLVLMSSAAARSPYLGTATYCAAKAGVEMWVRVTKRELADRGRRAWVTAVRPGFVDSKSTRAGAEMPVDGYPVGAQIARQLASGENLLTPDEAGRDIWAGLPPKNNESVLLFGTMVSA